MSRAKSKRKNDAYKQPVSCGIVVKKESHFGSAKRKRKAADENPGVTCGHKVRKTVDHNKFDFDPAQLG